MSCMWLIVRASALVLLGSTTRNEKETRQLVGLVDIFGSDLDFVSSESAANQIERVEENGSHSQQKVIVDQTQKTAVTIESWNTQGLMPETRRALKCYEAVVRECEKSNREAAEAIQHARDKMDEIKNPTPSQHATIASVRKFINNVEPDVISAMDATCAMDPLFQNLNDLDQKYTEAKKKVVPHIIEWRDGVEERIKEISPPMTIWMKIESDGPVKDLEDKTQLEEWNQKFESMFESTFESARAAAEEAGRKIVEGVKGWDAASQKWALAKDELAKQVKTAKELADKVERLALKDFVDVNLIELMRLRDITSVLNKNFIDALGVVPGSHSRKATELATNGKSTLDQWWDEMFQAKTFSGWKAALKEFDGFDVSDIQTKDEVLMALLKILTPDMCRP